MAQLVVDGNIQVDGIIQVDGWQHKYECIELAHFAVNEYNKKEHKDLKFVKIINVWSKEVMLGIMYFIALRAADGMLMKDYKAKVWVQPSLHLKQLLDFKPLL